MYGCVLEMIRSTTCMFSLTYVCSYVCDLVNFIRKFYYDAIPVLVCLNMNNVVCESALYGYLYTTKAL